MDKETAKKHLKLLSDNPPKINTLHSGRQVVYIFSPISEHYIPMSSWLPPVDAKKMLDEEVKLHDVYIEKLKKIVGNDYP